MSSQHENKKLSGPALSHNIHFYADFKIFRNCFKHIYMYLEDKKMASAKIILIFCREITKPLCLSLERQKQDGVLEEEFTLRRDDLISASPGLRY
jgi:hypothetical protein